MLLKDGTVIPQDQQAITIIRSLPHGHVAAALGTARKIGLDRLLGPDGNRCRDLVLNPTAPPSPPPAPPRGSRLASHCNNRAFTAPSLCSGISAFATVIDPIFGQGGLLTMPTF